MAIFTAVAAAISAIASWTIGLGALGQFAIGNFLLRTAVSLGVSALAKAFAGQDDMSGPQANPFSIQGSVRTGGTVPRSLMLGTSLTAGSLTWHSSWGNDGETPNAYYTQVLALSDVPVAGLSRWFINGEAVTMQDGGDHKGAAATEYRIDGKDHAWIRFHDGNQTECDAFMRDTVEPRAGRPYEASRVGHGVAYAVVTFLLNDKLFTGFPQSKFVVSGMKLYDVSKDGSQGGTGSHRWDDKATWGGDGDNLPAVQMYNLARGITYSGDWFYGLQGLTAARLPSAHWIAQIDKCRVQVEGETEGELEPIYRSAGEITVDSEIGAAFEALLTACAGRMSDVGGVFKAFVGAPDAPIAHITDADIVSLAPQTFTPFHGLSNTVNGVIASYPSPDEGYVSRSTPPLYNADYEAQDGGRRLMTTVELSFVPYPVQAQRLLQGELKAARRARRHTFTLPARYRKVEPGDTVSWSSARNDYDAKQFRVDGIIDLPNCDLIADLTEVDPADHGGFNKATDYTPPVTTPVVLVRPTVQGVVGFAALPLAIKDGAGADRRPGLLMQWNTTVEDIAGISFEIRLKASQAIVATGMTMGFASGELPIESGLVALETYEARAIYIPGSPRDVAWTSWIEVQTPDVRLGPLDFSVGSIELSALAQEVVDELDAKAANAASDAAAVVSVLPYTPGFPVKGWTNRSHQVLAQINPKLSYADEATLRGTYVSNDPDFGHAFNFNVGENWTLGPSYPLPYAAGRAYEILFRYKAIHDGNGAGPQIRVGYNSYSGGGSALVEGNAQKDVSAGVTIADGVIEHRILFYPESEAADYAPIIAGYDFAKAIGSVSDAADLIWFHFRSNADLGDGGAAALGHFEVRDITPTAGAAIAESKATASAQTATQAVTAAEFSRDVASVIVGGEAFQNPLFLNWDGEYPDGITWASATEGILDKQGGKYGNALRFRTGSPVTKWQPAILIESSKTALLDVGSAESVEGLQITLEAELFSANWGSGILQVKWVPGGTGGVQKFDTIRLSDFFAAETGHVQATSHVFRRPSGYVAGSAPGEVQIYLNASSTYDGASHGWCVYFLHRLGVRQLVGKASALLTQRALSELDGIQQAVIAFRAVAGSGGAEIELIGLDDPNGGSTSLARISAQDILLDGSVLARHLTISEFLDIDAVNAGFRMGKQSAFDFANDGVFMGRTDEGGGEVGFGLFAGRTAAGQEEYLQMTKANGLIIKNATFRIGSGTNAQKICTSSQSFTIPAGSQHLSMTLTAGGGGGGMGGGAGGSSGWPSSSGGNSVVKLRDGTTVKKTWTVNGGDGGYSPGYGGYTGGNYISAQNPYGNGGLGGRGENGGSDQSNGQGGRAGERGDTLTVPSYYIGNLSNPNVVVTIGGGGQGHGSGTRESDPGNAGRLVMQYTGETTVDAAPIGLEPAAAGTFQVTAGQSGAFPSIAPYRGLWMFWGAPSSWWVTVSPGFTVPAHSSVASPFIASQTPTWTTSNQTKTVSYRFWPM